MRSNNNQLHPQAAGNNPNRISLLGMEAGASNIAPMIASPAAEGWGPTMAMPTLMGMMPEMPNFDESGQEHTLLSLSGNRQVKISLFLCIQFF